MSDAIVGQGTRVAVRSYKTTGSISVEFDAAAKKLIRTTGSFVTDGFVSGMVIYTNSSNNPGPFTLTNVSALELTVSETLVDEGSPAPVTATITADLAIGEIISFDGPGGSADIIDATHLLSTAKEKLLGLPDEGQIGLECNLVPGDTGQTLMRTYRSAGTLGLFRITLTDDSGTEISFSAYVVEFGIKVGVNDKVTASIKLEISGAVTWS